MKTTGLTILTILLLMLNSCGGGGGGESAHGASLTVLHGTDPLAVQLSAESGRTVATLPALGSEGAFFSLRLPEGMVPGEMTWTRGDGRPVEGSLLALAQLDRGEIIAGAVPVGDVIGSDFRLEVIPAASPRIASAIEEGIREEPVQFATMDFDPNFSDLLLSWPAWIPGDYDLSGVVNIQDITPLGKNYGIDNGLGGQPWPQEDPLHWVDGNADGILNASDLSSIGQHFNDELLGFRIYYDGELYQGWDENLLNLLQGGSQGPGLPRRHFLHLPGIDEPALLELRAVLQRHGSSSGGSNPDLEVHVNIEGIEVVENGDGLKAGTRVIKPIEDVAGFREVIATPEREDSELSSFRGLPRGREYLLDVVYEPLAASLGGDSVDVPGTDDGRVITSVPFRLPELYGRSVMTVDIRYEQQSDGSFHALLDARVDHGSGVEEYSAMLEYARGILRRDSNNDGSFLGELEFMDSDRDCVSDQLISEIYGTYATPEENFIHGMVDGPLESIDYANSSITMSQESVQFWSDGIPRDDRTIYFSETAHFIGFSDIRSLQPGDFVHIETLRIEDPQGDLPPRSWAEFIHVLDQNFNDYWIQAELQENSELVAISVGQGGGPLDGSYPQYVVAIRDELTGEYLEIPYGEVGTGFIYVLLVPDHLYSISLLGFGSPAGPPVLLADTQMYVDPELFWDGFGDPPQDPPGGPIG